MPITSGDTKLDQLHAALTEARQQFNNGTGTQDAVEAAHKAVNDYSRAKTAEMQRAYMATLLKKISQ